LCYNYSMKTILYMAITPNGFIAGEKDDTSWVSKADWVEFVRTAKNIGNVILGKRTYDVLMKEKLFPIPGCLNIVMTSEKNLLAKGDWKKVFFTNESPRGVLEHLKEKGFEVALIGGGGRVSGSFMKAGLIDELYLSVMPAIVSPGIKLFEGARIASRLKFIDMVQTGKNEILLHYKVLKPSR
jgi:dihydrofolate reductase